MKRNRLTVVIALFAALGAAALSAQIGTIEGRVVTSTGEGLGGVTVAVDAEGAQTRTDATGHYALEVMNGTHEVVFSAASYSETAQVDVPSLVTVRLDQTFDWDLTPGERRVVHALERIDTLAHVPAAASVRPTGAATREAAHAQTPKLVEHTAGVQLAQSGIYDFNLSARGFNAPSSRRLAVRVDERDPSMLFLGGQEWAALTLPLATVSQVEVVRGPVSSVYGPNAAGGVMQLLTESPRNGSGGSVSLAGGDQSTLHGDLVWSQKLSPRWFLKLQGAHRESENFSVSRNTSVEYSTPCAAFGDRDCLPPEAVPLSGDDSEATSAGLRVDFHPQLGGRLTVEGGTSDLGGQVLLSDIGRLQIDDSAWRWARFDYDLGIHWNFRGSYRDRDAEEQRALQTGANVVLDEESWDFAVRTERSFGNTRLTAGLSHEEDSVDTSQILDFERVIARGRLNGFSREGSLLWQAVDEEADGAWAQVDFQAGDSLSLSLGLRYDDGSYFEAEWSPRAALVWQIDTDQSFRASYSEGFQAPTYSQLFMQFDSQAAFNFSDLEPICFFFTIACGFDFNFVSAIDAPKDTSPDTRVLTVGNAALEVEKTRTLELGYRVTPGRRVAIHLDYYFSENEDLIAGPLPQVGTSFGRLNPALGPYVVPAQVNPRQTQQILDTLQARLGDLFPFLTTNVDGTPIVATHSYANLGSTDTQGLDLEVIWKLADGWRLDFGYSWLDYDIDSAPPGLEDYLLPNAPENQATLGLEYVGSRFDGAVRYRWADDFRWGAGPWVGNVDSYSSADLFANVHITPNVALGANVANLLDDDQWQSFGGAMQGRRALGTLTLTW